MLLNPFSLSVESMAAMVNFEIVDDPIYSGLEIQRLDDDTHGRGIAVLLMRRDDRRVDVYHSAQLRLERSGYGIGAGIGEWRAMSFDEARLDVSDRGVSAALRMRDSAGRLVELRINDVDERSRRAAALLAPVSAAIEKPESMMLVWMPRFDLMRQDGEFALSIDGRAVSIGRLPMAFLHGRRLVKYAADLVVVRLNPATDGPCPTVAGETDLRTLAVATEGHVVRLELDPPLPALDGLADGTLAAGTWRLAIDDEPSVVSGRWAARRSGDEVSLELDSTARWRPRRLPTLMRVVTRVVPVFRNWPTTYRWRATLSLSGEPSITSRWERRGNAAVDSYRRIMRTDLPTEGSRSSP